jgi:hypothetical protein
MPPKDCDKNCINAERIKGAEILVSVVKDDIGEIKASIQRLWDYLDSGDKSSKQQKLLVATLAFNTAIGLATIFINLFFKR